MRDYAGLVNKLRRSCAILVDGGKCEDCAGSRCMEIDAADAIEELQEKLIMAETDLSDFKDAMAWKEHFDILAEQDCQVPTWISVEERLPEKDEMVIVYYSWIGQSGTEYKEVSLATLDEIRYCGSKLLGWMPLPKAPEEVE